ncbi:alpha/beta hydrolase [Paraburkholderia ginsengiterrae]|uniref:Alpha/beta hydrolase n=1 Tax=Paraburkholderia ginsengiterrae TaxID=1462993 RepID=A0A1A9N9T1_9BURK|nr:alpha/beta hydrolase [Paraburkholderia ginsengiterrae]OAJ62390.1 alpha/beta hydrolase [Paraburkholderia ginsengiterrae]OAJ62955.1 alpha/beta hydrolase [Paraburkholderia ginsengiterrae]
MLEPEITAFIERTSSIYSGHSTSLPPPEQRTIYERYAASLTPALPEDVVTQDAVLQTGADHPIALRLYRKRQTDRQAPRGTVLYFHGGGFVLGSLNSHQLVTARLAADTGLDVIAVDYRLAPEHRAPAAHDDCLAVTLAALEGRLPFDSPAGATLQLAGDSAGANLAAGVAIRLRDEGLQGVSGMALVYPMLGTDPQPPARDTEAHAPMLTLADVHAFRDLYWGEHPPYPAWTVPIDATRFDGLPPTLAIGVEHDPLRDDARVFAERINAAGGEAQFWIGTGLVHGCWRALESSPGVQAMHSEVCRFLSVHATPAPRNGR